MHNAANDKGAVALASVLADDGRLPKMLFEPFLESRGPAGYRTETDVRAVPKRKHRRHIEIHRPYGIVAFLARACFRVRP